MDNFLKDITYSDIKDYAQYVYYQKNKAIMHPLVNNRQLGFTLLALDSGTELSFSPAGEAVIFGLEGRAVAYSGRSRLKLKSGSKAAIVSGSVVKVSAQQPAKLLVAFLQR